MRLCLPVVSCFAALLSLAQTQAPRPDFRHAAWGMTKAQVLATEPNPPADVRESGGETIVRYDSVKLAGLDGTVLDADLIYIFAKDKLVRTKYLLESKHEDLNQFIADYHAVEAVLRTSYGEPAWQKAVWEDDSLQEEKKGYLDQDRATPDSILPSDRSVGLAISLGHVKFYTELDNVRTKVVHGLTGADGKVTHQIEYRSLELSALEDEVRGQATSP